MFPLAALTEIAFALDELGAEGVAMTSSYGEGSNAGLFQAPFG
jgi:hypothetical protein